MIILFNEWRKSLHIFIPNNFILFLKFFLKNFFNATKIFLKYFGWLFLIDSFLFIIFGDFVSKTNLFLLDSSKTMDISMVFLNLLISIVWFILSTGFLLSIRRNIAISVNYFKICFFRYIQLALIFSVVAFLFLNLLITLGISTFPNFNWILYFLIKLLELLIVFYWLDSEYYLRDILYSLEKALNLILYNLLFFVITFTFWWVLKWCITFAWINFETLVAVFFRDKFSEIFINRFIVLKQLFVRYLTFFGDYLVIGFVFAFYSLKKNINYTKSFFVKDDN